MGILLSRYLISLHIIKHHFININVVNLVYKSRALRLLYTKLTTLVHLPMIIIPSGGENTKRKFAAG